MIPGAMIATNFFQSLDGQLQQSCIDANIAEGQAINAATTQTLGTKNCP